MVNQQGAQIILDQSVLPHDLEIECFTDKGKKIYANTTFYDHMYEGCLINVLNVNVSV